MGSPPGKKHINIYVNSEYVRELKVYAAQTDTTSQALMKPLIEEFEQGILKLLYDIRAQRKAAESPPEKEPDEAIALPEQQIADPPQIF